MLGITNVCFIINSFFQCYNICSGYDIITICINRYIKQGGHYLNKQERGFTLLEVAAALLIISFIFIGILSLMQSTKKLSSENIDQLVMTSFATGSLKRFLDTPTLYISDIKENKNVNENNSCEKIKPINCYFEQMSFTEPVDIASYNQKNADASLYHLKANDKDYYLRFTLTQDEHEKRKELINVIAFVSKDSNFKKGRVKVEGYLSYAENTEAPKD